MEKAMIQLDNANIAILDNFVEAVCGERHIDNYYATIAVAVTNAVQYALAKDCGMVALSCGHYDKGICFSLSSAEGTFDAFQSEGSMLTEAPTSEMAFLTHTLADDLLIATDGSTLQVRFAVQGIAPRECAARIAVLEKFYQPALVEA